MLQGSGQSPSSIDGLSFKEMGSIVYNKKRALIKDIGSLPYPAKDLLLYTERLPGEIVKSIMGDIITSRGCPHACTFCANYTIWGSREVRLRAVSDVVDEIFYIKDKYNAKRFIFWDDHFTTDRHRTVDICNLLLERQANIEWVCLARANTIDEELLKLMKKAGCREIQIGIESGSDRILKNVNKGVTTEEIRKAARMIRKSGLRWLAFLMVGFPGEDRADMEATMGLIYELKPDHVELSVCTPYPGTPLFDELEEKGLLSDRTWLSADVWNADCSYTGTMTRQEFRELALKYMKECDEYNTGVDRRRLYLHYAAHPYAFSGQPCTMSWLRKNTKRFTFSS
jgi:radical SAM superfamily enzyme YgiQ (UPF0313 family)